MKYLSLALSTLLIACGSGSDANPSANNNGSRETVDIRRVDISFTAIKAESCPEEVFAIDGHTAYWSTTALVAELEASDGTLAYALQFESATELFVPFEQDLLDLTALENSEVEQSPNRWVFELSETQTLTLVFTNDDFFPNMFEGLGRTGDGNFQLEFKEAGCSVVGTVILID